MPFTFMCVLCLIFKGNLITFGSKRRKSQEEREGLAELMPPNSFTFGVLSCPCPFSQLLSYFGSEPFMADGFQQGGWPVGSGGVQLPEYLSSECWSSG